MQLRGEPRLSAALDHAHREAVARGHDRVATRHLLLGLLDVEECLAVVLLAGLGTDLPRLREKVEQSLPRRRRAAPGRPLPYSPNAARALDRAAREAREFGGGLRSPDPDEAEPPAQPLVRTEHLLLGLLGENRGVARLLNRAGVTHERALGQLERLLGLPDPRSAVIAIDPGLDLPVYQQIIEQVRTAVAVGRLAADDRLPPVRQLASELGIAPGTVARAYQELEQLGTVVTDRNRGTRVAAVRPAPGPDRERAARLVGLLRPIAVRAAHLGASPDEVRAALDLALDMIYRSAPALAPVGPVPTLDRTDL